ncbi:MAG: 4-hydroxy-3-methylbut-2-enyl diphosphate reductase [Hydrogenophaga sp.]|jgi:4-hydroxy-3-methylbut-2-enyl diphosphate reductase|nr:4-hydroxy-3-methylbut-2-enyl diphosphate reductase [Hydrogenophaga sp.]
MQVVLAQPRGFCAGVTRAIEIVERVLDLHGAPVYVFHEIVHNQRVVDDLRSRGAVFVDTLDGLPAGSQVVFSAHGVSRAVVAQAHQLHLHAVDATCPLVAKVHQQAQRFARQGRSLVMIGHAGHEEVVGTMGQVDVPVHLISRVADVAALDLPAQAPLAYVTQTTLSLEDTRELIAALQARFPHIVGPEVDDICYATQNRQVAVRALAGQVDLVLVVGARNSSNSNRLREVAAQAGVPAHLVQDARDIQPDWLRSPLLDTLRVGVTSGASTPEPLVQEVLESLRERHPGPVVQLPGVKESTQFRLPAELAG